GVMGAHALYLTAAEVAEMLQVDPKTVLRYAQADPSFPCLRFGRAVRFPRCELHEWLQRRTQGSRRISRRKLGTSVVQVTENAAHAPDRGSSAGGSSGATPAEHLRSDT